jgi:hypothetical protein
MTSALEPQLSSAGGKNCKHHERKDTECQVCVLGILWLYAVHLLWSSVESSGDGMASGKPKRDNPELLANVHPGREPRWKWPFGRPASQLPKACDASRQIAGAEECRDNITA